MRASRRAGAALSWLLAAAAGGAAAQAGEPCMGTPAAALDAAIEQQVAVPLEQAVARHDSSAAVVTFVRDGQVRLARAAGLEEPEQRVPVTTALSRFAVSSVSKTFMAVSLAQLRAGGRIRGYDDAANRYLHSYHLPDFGTRQVTLRELATHTSGLDKVVSGMSVLQLLPEQAAAGQIRDIRPLFFRPPGAITAYSDFGIDVLGLLVADVSGMSYGEYLRTQVLDPLGMTGTVAGYPPGGVVPHEVKAFDPVRMRLLKPPKYAAPLDYPADGVFTTANDMARYLLALLDPGEAGPISPAVRRDLEQVLYQVNPLGSAHALVFELLRAREHTVVYHMGVDSNICLLAVVPDRHAGLFYCVENAQHALDPQQLPKAAFDALTGACRGPAAGADDPPASPAWKDGWNRYLGDFISTDRQYFGPARLRDVMHPDEVPILRVARGRTGLSVNGTDGLKELSPAVFGVPGGFEVYSFYRDALTGHLLVNSSTEATAVFERVGLDENPEFEHTLLPGLVLLTASGLLWPLWPGARRQSWAAAGAVLLGLATCGQVASLAAHPWDGYLIGTLWPLDLMRVFAFASVPAAALLSAGIVRAWRTRPAHTEAESATAARAAPQPAAGIGISARTHLLVLTLAAWLAVWALMHLGMIGFLR